MLHQFETGCWCFAVTVYLSCGWDVDNGVDRQNGHGLPVAYTQPNMSEHSM